MFDIGRLIAVTTVAGGVLFVNGRRKDYTSNEDVAGTVTPFAVIGLERIAERASC